MPVSNTTDSYGSVARMIHWLMALLVISMIPLGFRANVLAHQIEAGAAEPAILSQAQLLFSLHKTIGVGIFFLALVRILWALTNPKPKPLHPEKRGETFLANLVRWLLYASLLLVPLTGWIHHAATTGFAPIWWPFGQSLPFVPKDLSTAETFASLHIIFGRILVASIVLHLSGALKHHFFDRDATLKRMWNGTAAEGSAARPSNKLAPLMAAVVYIATIGIGTNLGLFNRVTIQAATLESVVSDWTVTDGTLAISNRQLGAEIEGSFANWTIAIKYDPTITEGEVGKVATRISIGSLTLGSVTPQAMAPDYFNTAAFPIATYYGTLIRDINGLRSEGKLTIKDTSVPVTFPFTLTLDGDTATMSGTTTLNRFDYDIGGTIAKGTLAAEVIVTINLTATKGD